MQTTPPTHATSFIADARRYLTDLTVPTLRLGVTGLAQAGKTVFITALVRNLTAGGRLPFFGAHNQGRILACYLEPQPDDNIPRFDYEAHLDALLDSPPRWPHSTRQISQLRLTIDYQPTNPVWRRLGPARLHVDIVDYPGEWLVDLQMLEQNYSQWSAAQMQLARSAIRNTTAGPWLEQAATLDASAPASEDLARHTAAIYTTYLAAARDSGQSLGTLGPGRFLMPGDLAGSPLLTFAPLDIAPNVTIAPGTLAAMMARRYESYKTYVAKPFFRNHFARIDRQIVIVDALTSLNHGPEAVEQLTAALENALRTFRPGPRTWLSRIIDRRIDRIAFAATKADHLPHTSHDRLQAALETMMHKALERVETAGGEVRALAMAAIRATRESTARDEQGQIFCIQGVPMPGETIDGQTFDGTREVAVFPGDLPDNPAAAFKQAAPPLNVRFLRFRPPLLSDPRSSVLNAPPWPHIRLDRAIEFLIGDYLQ